MTPRECQYFTLDLWFDLWQNLSERNLSGSHVSKPSYTYYSLAEKYQEAHRHYHDLSHIDQSVGLWLKLRHLMNDPWACLLALVYHDCILDPYAKDNEVKSADEMERVYHEVGLFRDATLHSARRYVIATDHARLSDDNDVQLVCDIDLVALAADWDTFDRNTMKIFREYHQTDDQAFCEGRIKVLERLAARGVFQHPSFEPLEVIAQKNIHHSVERLKGFLLLLAEESKGR